MLGEVIPVRKSLLPLIWWFFFYTVKSGVKGPPMKYNWVSKRGFVHRVGKLYKGFFWAKIGSLPTQNGPSEGPSRVSPFGD